MTTNSHRKIVILFILISLNSFSQMTVHPTGSMAQHAGANSNILGDLTISGTHNHNATSSKLFSGTTKQTITVTGSDTVTFHYLTLDNSFGVEIDGVIEVDGQFNFISGQMSVQPGATNVNSKVIFLDGSMVGTGANEQPDNNSFLKLPTKKIGDDAFIFPVGDGNLYRPISMTAPSVATDEFTVEYHRNSPTLDGYAITSKEASIDNVSDFGYYDVERTSGTSDVTLALYYDALEWVLYDSHCNLVVTHWNGSQWENLGNGGSLGTFLSNGSGVGSCGTPQLVTSFSPFALGSVSSGLTLPVELIGFTAIKQENDVLLSWSTATEINSDYFDVEHSLDGLNWDHFATVDANGTSNVLSNYSTLDSRRILGDNYYRLKQVDQDGIFDYSEVRVVNFDLFGQSNIVVYPNPTDNFLTIQTTLPNIEEIQIFDAMGKDVSSLLVMIESSNRHISYTTEALSEGVYIVYLSGEKEKFIKR